MRRKKGVSSKKKLKKQRILLLEKLEKIFIREFLKNALPSSQNGAQAL